MTALSTTLVGTTFVYRGYPLKVVGTYGAEYEIQVVGGFGVFFASPAQLEAALAVADIIEE